MDPKPVLTGRGDRHSLQKILLLVTLVTIAAISNAQTTDYICEGDDLTLDASPPALWTVEAWYSAVLDADPYYVKITGSEGMNSYTITDASPADNDYYRPRYMYAASRMWGETATVIVRARSYPPTATTDPVNPSLCPDGAPPITLMYTGGVLGYQASAKWYTNSACTEFIGDDDGSGLSIAYPSTETTYYVRFEGYCNNTSPRSVTVTPKTESVKPSGASCDRDNICPSDGNIQLSYSGGKPGTGATAIWYRDPSFTDAAGAGNNLIIAAPAQTTTYYVRFEGDCNNSGAESVTVNVKTPAVAPTSAHTNRNNICPGDGTVSLSFSGGSAGFPAATAQWYSDPGCTNPVGTGNGLLIATPGSTTTYYVRYEGDCNTTSTASTTLNIKSLSTNPTSAGCDRDNICAGDGEIVLSYTGGTLGTGATANWYRDATFTDLAGTGNDLTLTVPAATTTYYVRFEGDCNVSSAENVTVNIKSNSEDPVSAHSNRNNICPGDGGLNLTYSGGSLGTGAVARWYDNSKFNNLVGEGNNLDLAVPSTTTTYYVRFEGECNTTNAASITVIIKTESEVPSEALCDRDNICPFDGDIVLSYSGGILGTGAIARWYRDDLFTNLAGSGNGLTLEVPNDTTTYYVRFEGDCNETAGESVTVNIKSRSMDPAGAEADRSTVCSGDGNITLTYSGGSPGTGAVATWYTDPLFTQFVGTDNNLVLPAPTVTTTYFVRFEGECNNSNALTAHVDVNTYSENPGSASCDRDSICPGDGDITLSYSGGVLGTGAAANWYRDAGYTDFAGDGNDLVIPAHASTQTYYLRFEGTCNTTDAVNITVNTKTVSVAPDGAECDRPVVCPGDGDITLSYTGGSFGTGALAKWYSDDSFTTPIDTGNNLVIPAPVTQQAYYVRFEGDCNESGAASVIVDMASQSINPSGIIASKDSICSNESVNLSISDGELGQGGAWRWYSNTCGGTYHGSGNSINVSPSASTTYFIRAEGQCDTTTCISKTIHIKDSVKIQTQPDDLTICEGSEAIFRVLAVGINPTYQWRIGETNIHEETDSIYSIPVSALDDEGIFSCLITDECNSVETREVHLSMLPVPVILKQPSSNNACTGENIVLSISTIHTDSVKFQWKIGEADIPGASDSILQLVSVGSGDIGMYKCQVTDLCGIVNSNNAMVSVYPAPPSITLGEDQRICYGEELILEAGIGFTSYLWSNSANTHNLSVTVSGEYYVTCSDFNGCYSHSDTVNIDIREPFDQEKICVVTVDLATGQNMVIWEKTADEGIQSYNIYREDELIGNVAYDALSVFKDTVADPETRPYLYSLSIVDTCGNESDESPYHKPLFLQYVSSVDGVNLRWSKYEIEDGEITFSEYAVYRGSDSLSLSPFAENIPTVVDVYTDNDPLALLRKYYYRVAGILGTPCDPDGGDRKAGTGPFVHSLSNLDNNKLKTGQFDPDSITLDTNSIDEGNMIGARIGKLSTLDRDTADKHIYTFVSGTGDDDNNSFTITGDQLMADEVFDYESRNQYSIRLRSTDPAGKYVEIVFIILINDVDETTGLPVEWAGTIRTYPNPFTQSTTILFPNQVKEPYNLYLTDLSGKVCRIIGDIRDSKYILERDGLGTGLYFVELRGPKVYRGKLVIE